VRIFRAHDHDVGRELDLAVFQVHRLVEIDDAPVMRIGDREREVDAPRNALIASRVTKLFAVKYICAGCDLNADDTGVDWQNARSKKQN